MPSFDNGGSSPLNIDILWLSEGRCQADLLDYLEMVFKKIYAVDMVGIYRLLHGKCAHTVFMHELLAYQGTNE